MVHTKLVAEPGPHRLRISGTAAVIIANGTAEWFGGKLRGQLTARRPLKDAGCCDVMWWIERIITRPCRLLFLSSLDGEVLYGWYGQKGIRRAWLLHNNYLVEEYVENIALLYLQFRLTFSMLGNQIILYSIILEKIDNSLMRLSLHQIYWLSFSTS